MKITVRNIKTAQNKAQSLWVAESRVVLLHALIVDDLNEARQIKYVHIDAVQQGDILVDIVSDNDDFAGFTRG